MLLFEIDILRLLENFENFNIFIKESVLLVYDFFILKEDFIFKKGDVENYNSEK